MQKTLLSTALMAVLPFPASLLAETTLNDRLESAESRIHYLESRIRDQDETLNNKVPDTSVFNRVELSGVIEVEAGYEDPDNADSESSLTLATAELGITAQLTDRVSGEIVLLYEDDGEEALDVDVAAITLAASDSWAITAGQFYVPFGVFETQMISDPLTLEMGETRETAVQVGYSQGTFGLSAYLFDGDAREEDASKIDNFGLDLALAEERDAFSYAANLGYINDLGDSDGLIDYAGTRHDRVAGLTAGLIIVTGPFTLIGEYLGALDAFATGEEPSAFNLEAGYGFDLAGREAGVAIGIQGTDDAAAVGLPEDVVAAAFSVAVADNTALAVEYARAEDYAGAKTETLTLQLAAEF